MEEGHEDEIEEAESGSRTPTESPTSTSPHELEMASPSQATNGVTPIMNGVMGVTVDVDQSQEPRTLSRQASKSQKPSLNGEDQSHEMPSRDSEAKLDALNQERESLREEVAQVRKALEQLQQRHEAEIRILRDQLKDTHDEKEQAETQYRNLLGKVNTIRSQLGDRLKADAVSGDCSLESTILLISCRKIYHRQERE